MKLREAQRYSRQIALPELGPVGQQRIFEAVVALFVTSADGIGLETATMYLAAAGVRTFRVLVPDSKVFPPWLARLQALHPVVQVETVVVTASKAERLAALNGCAVAVGDTFNCKEFFDANGDVACRAVILRSDGASVDVWSLDSVPPHAPAVSTNALAAMTESAKVVAGTFAAAEVLWLLSGRDREGRVRHLHVPFSSLADRHETRNIPGAAL